MTVRLPPHPSLPADPTTQPCHPPACRFCPAEEPASSEQPAQAAHAASADDLLALLQLHLEQQQQQQQGEAEAEAAPEQAPAEQQQQHVPDGQQQQQQQQLEQQRQQAACAPDATPAAAGSSGRAACRPSTEPCTPQRRSAGDDNSSWNESPLPGGLECGEVQSPGAWERRAGMPAAVAFRRGAFLASALQALGPSSALCCTCPVFRSSARLTMQRLPSLPLPPPTHAAPASMLGLPSAAPPCPAAARRVPLQLAIANARRVRLGQEPLLGAWRGCAASAWCPLAPCHAGACTSAALVPGLLAYPSHELFESGVNVEELCRWVGRRVGGEWGSGGHGLC